MSGGLRGVPRPDEYAQAMREKVAALRRAVEDLAGCVHVHHAGPQDWRECPRTSCVEARRILAVYR